MSFSLDNVKNLPAIAGVITAALSFIWLFLGADQNITISLLGTLLIGGFFYIILNDYEQRKQIEEMEGKKENAKVENIKTQRDKDLGKNNCISCNQPVKSTKEKCPNCGFLLDAIEAQ